MDVLSPVGRFPMRIRGISIKRSGITVNASLGAWNSEVYIERGDLPTLAGAVFAVFGTGFLLGRVWRAHR